MAQVDLLLTGGMVVTMNGRFDIFVNGAVAVDGDSIVAVGEVGEVTAVYTARETLDCTGHVIMPGLVNAHTHIPMTLLRGLNDDLRLDVWLGYLMPLEREFVTPDFVRLGSRIACAITYFPGARCWRPSAACSCCWRSRRACRRTGKR